MSISTKKMWHCRVECSDSVATVTTSRNEQTIATTTFKLDNINDSHGNSQQKECRAVLALLLYYPNQFESVGKSLRATFQGKPSSYVATMHVADVFASHSNMRQWKAYGQLRKKKRRRENIAVSLPEPPMMPVEPRTQQRKAPDDVCDECSVCFEPWQSTIRVCLIPCGHALVCGSCAGKVNQCPTCRTPIQRSVRVYL